MNPLSITEKILNPDSWSESDPGVVFDFADGYTQVILEGTEIARLRIDRPATLPAVLMLDTDGLESHFQIEVVARTTVANLRLSFASVFNTAPGVREYPIVTGAPFPVDRSAIIELIEFQNMDTTGDGEQVFRAGCIAPMATSSESHESVLARTLEAVTSFPEISVSGVVEKNELLADGESPPIFAPGVSVRTPTGKALEIYDRKDVDGETGCKKTRLVFRSAPESPLFLHVPFLASGSLDIPAPCVVVSAVEESSQRTPVYLQHINRRLLHVVFRGTATVAFFSPVREDGLLEEFRRMLVRIERAVSCQGTILSLTGPISIGNTEQAGGDDRPPLYMTKAEFGIILNYMRSE